NPFLHYDELELGEGRFIAVFVIFRWFGGAGSLGRCRLLLDFGCLSRRRDSFAARDPPDPGRPPASVRGAVGRWRLQWLAASAPAAPTPLPGPEVGAADDFSRMQRTRQAERRPPGTKPQMTSKITAPTSARIRPAPSPARYHPIA